MKKIVVLLVVFCSLFNLYGDITINNGGTGQTIENKTVIINGEVVSSGNNNLIIINGEVVTSSNLGNIEKTVEEKKYPFDSDKGKIEIDNTASMGRIAIEGTDANEIVVKVIKHTPKNYGHCIDVNALFINPAEFLLKTKLNKECDRAILSRCSVDLNIQAPQSVTVAAAAKNNSITIDRVQNVSWAETNNAQIECRNIKGDVNARTSNAPIICQGVEGNVNARTSNAFIKASVLGEKSKIYLKTSNGKVYLNLLPTYVGKVFMKTSNGSQYCDGFLSTKNRDDASVIIETSNSSINVEKINK